MFLRSDVRSILAMHLKPLARVPVTASLLHLYHSLSQTFEYLPPRGKTLQRTFGILIELPVFAFSFLLLDSKVGFPFRFFFLRAQCDTCPGPGAQEPGALATTQQ